MNSRGASPRGCGSAPVSLAFFHEMVVSMAPLPRIFVGIVVENEMETLVTRLAEDISSPTQLQKLGYSTSVETDSLVTLTALSRADGPAPLWLEKLQNALGPKLVYFDANALETRAKDYPGLHERYFGTAESRLSEARQELRRVSDDLTRARLEIRLYEKEFKDLSGRAKRLRDAEAWRQMAELTQHYLTTKLAALLLMVDRNVSRSPSEWEPNTFRKVKATVQELRERVLLLEGRNVRSFVPVRVSYDDVRERVQSVADAQKKTGVKVVFRSRSGSGIINVDLDGLGDCVEELVGNAGHWEAEGRTLEIRLLVSIETLPAGERAVQIVCEDNGQGIPDPHKHLIFLPTHTLRMGGKGLGLHMLKRFSEIHRGECYENGRPDSGARFVLRLPLEREEEVDAHTRD